MNKYQQSFENVVAEINRIYSDLSAVSNDNLRLRIRQIEHNLNSAEDSKETLTKFLPEVYAIVKETSRRFSLGNIEVTANNYDRWLAEETDFVSIHGNKAIYLNHWQVGETLFRWDMVHYDEQILGGIHLHYGYAIEMATGEGKTLVATLPVFLNALTHKGIHLMTVNDYLSKRDYEITRPIYSFYGLTTDCLGKYQKRQDIEYKEAYRSDILFGTNSSFVFDYLFDHLALNKNECVQSKHNFALIDELDSILIDDAGTPHIVSGGITYNDEKIFKKYFSLVRELIEVNDGYLFSADNTFKNVVISEEGKKWIREKLDNKTIFKFHRTYEITDFHKLTQDEQDEILMNIKIQNVIRQLLVANTVYTKDIDYVVKDGKVVIVDQNTGRLKNSSRWEHGLHTAIEVKENVAVKDDSDGMAVISLKNYFKLYDKICGMSGTIIDAQDELKEIYDLECVKIPTHRPLKRTDSPLQIYRTEEQKDKAILNAIAHNHQLGKPILIGCISIKRADEIGQKLKEAGLRFNRLDAMSLSDEASIVAKAGISNTITLSTPVAGRGTDIKPSEDALEKGGLCVIGADLFGARRTDLQLKGRSGRQGNPGQSIFFSSLDDMVIGSLTPKERAELNEVSKDIQGENLSCDKIRKFFQHAQDNRENFLRMRRKATARKDDIVAPRRAKFYDQRNSVLYNAEKADEIISSLAAESEFTLTDINHTLTAHYPMVKELLMRNKRNNLREAKTFIPFSYHQHPFAIQVDIDLALTSDAYFRQEFKRQCILQVYDTFWKDFVVYMMQNLDQHEIDNLDNVYSKMMKEITAVIVNRLMNSTITFELRDIASSPIIPNYDVKGCQVGITKPDKENLCPCGSGKKFGECHGKNSYRNKRRSINRSLQTELNSH